MALYYAEQRVTAVLKKTQNRRDFTFNRAYYNVQSFSILTITCGGLKDIEDKTDFVLLVTLVKAAIRDPARIVAVAIRFAGKARL